MLCQIIAEYNHANNKKLNTDSLFLSDLNRMSDYVGLDMVDLKISLDELSYLGFISVWDSGIENIKLIYVSEKNIIKYKEQEEQKNFWHDWDWGLARTQNPVNKSTNFEQSTLKMIDFVEKHIEKPENIPLAVYAYCNLKIKSFEEQGSCFWNIQNFENNLYKVLTANDFTPKKIVNFVDKTYQDNKHLIDEISFEE